MPNHIKTFWIKSLLLVFLVSATVIIIFLLPFVLPSNPLRYLAEHKDKVNLLINTPSPRIILVGGSNVAYSINSQQIENKTGFHVINAGLEGGLGLRVGGDSVHAIRFAPRHAAWMSRGSDAILTRFVSSRSFCPRPIEAPMCS